MTLEEAILTRQEACALEMLKVNAALATGETGKGVSLLMLSLYCGLPSVANAIASLRQNLDLFDAAVVGDVDAVAEHFDRDPAARDAFASDGFTVLGLAVFFSQPQVAKLPIDRGAYVNLSARNAQKVAPIHAACARVDLSLVKLLIANGADVNLRQEGGFTPLMAATASGNRDSEEALREAGATS